MSGEETELTIEPFCPEWDSGRFISREAEVGFSYISKELERVAQSAEGKVLTPVLHCPHDYVKTLALQMLASGLTPAQQPCFQLPGVLLRLVEPSRLKWKNPVTEEEVDDCATPPLNDPQGRPVKGDKRGNVLLAKVGNLGGKINPSLEATAAEQFSGEKREQARRAGRDLYELVEITRKPKLFNLRNAVLVMQSWGFGVKEQIFSAPNVRVEGDKKIVTRGQCFWLVEEVPQRDF